jgi:tripartite-type tricarboxylate transporter receptor subunit TctC
MKKSDQWSGLFLLAIATAILWSSSRMPDIPTFKELGFDVVLAATHYIAAPAATPDPIIQYLSGAFKKAFAEKAFAEAMDSLETVGGWESPESSVKSLQEIDRMYLRVIKKLDLKTN